MNKHFPFLSQGQIVALIGPGTPVNETVAFQAKQYLWHSYKLSAVYAADAYSKMPAQERADILLKYLYDEHINALWALRGGEGTADLIPFLHMHAERIKQIQPKLLMGFSDFTALLIYFSQVFNWPVLHCSGVPQFLNKSLNADSEHRLMDFILGKTRALRLADLRPLNDLAKMKRKITANINGGNLSLINISVKESWELFGNNKILIIEDVREKPHVVDRTLKHLQRIGMFTDVQAIIFGDFTCVPIGSDQGEQDKNAQALNEVLVKFAQTCDFPVLHSLQIGHGRDNLPILFGMPADLQLDQQAGQMIIEVN